MLMAVQMTTLAEGGDCRAVSGCPRTARGLPAAQASRPFRRA